MSTPNVADPDWYASASRDEVAATFAELRRTDPVHRVKLDDETSAWMVLRHADVVQVARNPQTFSASLGGVVLDDLDEATLEGMRRMLLAMDPPGHTAHRQPLAPHFAARVIGRMEEQVRNICRATFERLPDGEELDYVHRVCAPLPSLVVAELFGLPVEDVPRIHEWAERSTTGQDADVAGDDVATSMLEMAGYFFELVGSRRNEPPREDLTSVVLESTYDGRPMTDEEAASFMVQVVIAGNDTTKTMLSSGTLVLLQHPEAMALLRDDPSVLPSAVEEVLRFANPLHYFRRTATTDTEIAGTAIAADDKLAMVYTSANRDESVFDGPDRFDVQRHPNPHLAFGIGPHFCLGAHLARLEGRVFFDELLTTFSTIELTGDPVPVRSNLNNAYKRLPITLHR